MQNKTIRQPITAQEIQRRWRYRPEGQPLEQFCERWGYTPAQVRRELEHGARASTVSLDAQARGGNDDSDGSSLIELLADPIREDQLLQMDLAAAVENLRDLGGDDLALLELHVEGTKQADLASLLGVPRSSAGEQVRKARRRLAALAGPEALELLVA